MNKKGKVMVLGSGPNRIGQGIEFDYTCVHAAFAIREEGLESIMVNCNPETVSTDYDTSDKLYFEPLTFEDVLNIYEKEQPLGVIVQFGGQTPLNIARELEKKGVVILGTSPESIDMAEDRDRFRTLLTDLNIPQPKGGMASSKEQAICVASEIGYPVMVRPSYVLGGRAMQIVYDEEMLENYINVAIKISPEHPILIDKFLEGAIETDVDAVSDGNDVFIGGIMEHIEEAGIHSGDSACIIPPYSLKQADINKMKEYTRLIACQLKVKGLLNIQFAVVGEEVYLLEANPRASRTVPLISKVTGIPLAKIATKVILGKTLDELSLSSKGSSVPLDSQQLIGFKHVAVKEAVFSFSKFPNVDPLLGPEMKATGEVMGIDTNFGLAFYKSQVASGMDLPVDGTILITVAEKDKSQIVTVAKKFKELGFEILCTAGTYNYLLQKGVEVKNIFKVHEGRPNIIDYIKNRDIGLIINTPAGKGAKYDDSCIRKAALQYNIPYITTVAGAKATVAGIEAVKHKDIGLKSIQEYYKDNDKIF